MRRMKTRLLVAVGALLAAGGCDAGEESRGESARVPAAPDSGAVGAGATGPMVAGCSIVPEAELEAALGFAVLMNDNAGGSCVITAESGSPGAPALDVRREDRTTAFDYFSAQADATPIEGLGDRAVWATLNEMTGSLVVVTRDSAVTIAIARADGLTPDDRRLAEAVGRLVVGAGRQ